LSLLFIYFIIIGCASPPLSPLNLCKGKINFVRICLLSNRSLHIGVAYGIINKPDTLINAHPVFFWISAQKHGASKNIS